MDNAWLKWCSKCPPPACTQADKRRRQSPLTNSCCDVTMMSSLVTVLPIKQEKYFITHLHAWSIAMEHAKNYEIKCKIMWNIRTKRVAPFSGQCNERVKTTRARVSSYRRVTDNIERQRTSNPTDCRLDSSTAARRGPSRCWLLSPK